MTKLLRTIRENGEPYPELNGYSHLSLCTGLSKQRGKLPGWPKGRKSSLPPRFKAVKRGKKKAKSA
jgi:hypothetical protein